MALASPTPWVEGTQTALAAPTQTPFTETFMERPTDFPLSYMEENSTGQAPSFCWAV